MVLTDIMNQRSVNYFINKDVRGIRDGMKFEKELNLKPKRDFTSRSDITNGSAIHTIYQV